MFKYYRSNFITKEASCKNTKDFYIFFYIYIRNKKAPDAHFRNTYVHTCSEENDPSKLIVLYEGHKRATNTPLFSVYGLSLKPKSAVQSKENKEEKKEDKHLCSAQHNNVYLVENGGRCANDCSVSLYT